jgi:glycosyltransferase involved in cell wall biosynthesis
MVELSVIIAVKNGADFIGLQLGALLEQCESDDWEIVVADNGSTDDTRELVERIASENSRVRLVHAAEQPGAGHARNIGASQALGKYFAFCDADDLVGAQWVVTMLNGLREHSFVSGPMELDSLNDPRDIETRGRWFGQHERTVFEDLFPFAASCNMGVRRDVFDAVGGFDQSFLTGEDIEFSLRLRCKGIELAWLSDALVHYRYRSGFRSSLVQSYKYGVAAARVGAAARRAGLAVPRARIRWRSWLWLARHAHTAWLPSRRSRWSWVFANKLGRLRGSIRARRLDA